jgi:LacI family fructose operon transcriptional repressor
VTTKLLDQAERPDAIFTSNSLLITGAFQTTRDCGLVVPGEVALVGFDETTWGVLVDPPITVIAQPTEEIGHTATELLLQRINRFDFVQAHLHFRQKNSLVAKGVLYIEQVIH